MRIRNYLALFLCLALFPSAVMAQGNAVISGKITDESGEALPGANIFIQLTNLGTAADVNGDYSFTVPDRGVRSQEVKLEVRFIGYRTKVEKLTLSPGTHTVDFALVIDALEMDAIVVTGVVDGTPKTKLAFAVGRVSSEALEQVTSTSVESALRGKVAGVKIIQGSGVPGVAASVLLRAPTSIDASGRSQDPLYIIDGVIIDPSISGSPMSDINSDDIESIEVVKGAAGASLYGSRAANGVINITTNRGRNLALNSTRIRFRNEFGFNELRKDYPLRKSHHYRIHQGTSTYTDLNGITVNPGDFIDGDDNFVDPRSSATRVIDRYRGFNPATPDEDIQSTIAFADKPYKWISTGDILLDQNLQPLLDASGVPVGLTLLPGGQPINQIQQFFDPGTFISNSVSLTRNMLSTNFSLSASNRGEEGVIGGLDGYNRQTIRLALDHKFRKNLTISTTAFYSLVKRDDIDVGVGSPFFGMVFTSGDVDLAARHAPVGTLTDDYNSTSGFPDGLPQDVGGELFIIPDPSSERTNPLYEPAEAVRKREQTRFMGGASLSFRPYNWLTLDGSLSYDRSNREFNRFWHVGYQSEFDPDITTGRYRKLPAFDEAINGNVTASFQNSFFNNELTVRSKVRGLFERTEFASTDAEGTGLSVRGVPDLNVAAGRLDINSAFQQIRSSGYSFITGMDYKDRYIGDFLIRRDGSSLFGPDDRWNTYYRVSGAYRLSQESWWMFKDKIQEFKIRASYGTAGGRPNFFARFETWSVADGAVSKNTLGNTALKPEYAKELEFGLDFTFLDRFTVEITRAESDVEDQLLVVPLASYVGYANQWINGGTLSTDTWEFSLQASLIQKRDMRLSAGFLVDRTRQVVSKLDIAPYNWVPTDTQGLNIFRIEQGVEFGALWGNSSIFDAQDLLLQGVTEAELSQFQVNDAGYVVWVGDGNTWKEGISKELWGLQTKGDRALENGETYDWGMPIDWEDETGNDQKQIGSTVPDFNWSTFANFQWKGISLYGLFDAQVGGDLYSQSIQWGYSVEMNQKEADQAGVSDELKKPTLYWNRANQRGNFIFDAGYIKLRELSVKYTFKQQQLSGVFGGLFKKLSFGVVGRNLFSWDNYDKGYDPEVGITGSDGGSAVITRIDAFRYPNFRSFTGILEFEF